MISCTANNEYIEASKDVDRRLPFRCPECECDLILKAGDIKIPHFAHKVDTGCHHGQGETEWHRLGKTWTANFLRKRGWRVHLEYKLGVRRTDLFAENLYGFRTCFEFQRKDEGSVIYQRTRDLAQYCDEVAWVLPFNCQLISKMWRANQTYAINALYSQDKRPEKSAVFFFREWSPNLYECAKHDWVIGVEEYQGNGGYYKRSKKWCQLEILSLGGGKYSQDLRGVV